MVTFWLLLLSKLAWNSSWYDLLFLYLCVFLCEAFCFYDCIKTSVFCAVGTFIKNTGKFKKYITELTLKNILMLLLFAKCLNIWKNQRVFLILRGFESIFFMPDLNIHPKKSWIKNTSASIYCQLSRLTSVSNHKPILILVFLLVFIFPWCSL